MKVWRYIVCLVLAMHCVWSIGQPPPTASIQFAGETTGLSFNAAEPSTEVWMQVKVPERVDLKTVVVTVQSVHFDKKPDAESLKRFTVRTPLAASDKEPPTLVLRIHETEKLVPGPYTVLFSFSGAKSASVAGKPTVDVALAPLQVTLERRSAAVAAPGKQVIEVTEGASTSAAPTAIRLSQSTDARSSQLRNLTASTGPFSRADGTQVAGVLNPSLPASAAAGADLQLAVNPTKFPIGSATGKVFIRSPDLKEPLSFDVEVKAKRGIAWLFIWVALGLAAGYVLRILLQGRIEKKTAQNLGAESLLQVEEEQRRIPDQLFRNAISTQVTNLTAATTKGKVAEIGNRVGELTTALAKARMELIERLQTVQTKLEPAAKFARTFGLLPPEIREVLGLFRDETERVLDFIRSKDAVGAEQVLEDAYAQLSEGLEIASSKAYANFKQASSNLLALKALLNRKNIEVERADTFASVSNEAGLAVPDALQSAEAMRAYLAAWTDAASRRTHAITRIADYLEDDAETLVTLGGRKVAGPLPSFKVLAGEVLKLARSTATELGDYARLDIVFKSPEVDTSHALKAYAELVAAVGTSRQGEALTAELAMLDELRLAGDFFGALHALPDARQAGAPISPPLATSVGFNFLGGLPDRQKRVFESINERSSGLRALGQRFSRNIELDSPRSLQAFHARTATELVVLSWLQALSVFAIVTVASYALFGDRFVGTWPELAGLFFWGFTTDLSVAKLTELSSPLAAKPKTP